MGFGTTTQWLYFPVTVIPYSVLIPFQAALIAYVVRPVHRYAVLWQYSSRGAPSAASAHIWWKEYGARLMFVVSLTVECGLVDRGYRAPGGGHTGALLRGSWLLEY